MLILFWVELWKASDSHVSKNLFLYGNKSGLIKVKKSSIFVIINFCLVVLSSPKNGTFAIINFSLFILFPNWFSWASIFCFDTSNNSLYLRKLISSNSFVPEFNGLGSKLLIYIKLSESSSFTSDNDSKAFFNFVEYELVSPSFTFCFDFACA